MSDHGHEKPNIKLYLAIFATLMVLTVVTVAVSYWHLPPKTAIAVGLAIASFKAGLVIAFFMHMKGEHKLIFAFMGIMLFTLIGFLIIPIDFHLISGRNMRSPGGGPEEVHAEQAEHMEHAK